MKLGSFQINGRRNYGAVIAEGSSISAHASGHRYPDLRSLLAAEGGMAQARRLVHANKPDATLEEVLYLPVIPNPEKIFCIGVNYADHLEETNIRKASHPTVFLRCASSQVGHQQPMLLPRESSKFDFEGEWR